MPKPEVLDYTGNRTSGRLQTVRVDSAERDKLPILEALLRSLDNGKALVFVNHRESAERVHGFLKQNGFPAGLYHGGLEQRERKLAIDLLNNSTTPILVSTDLGARGLDIDNVQYVIHYHLPPSMESWTHRNGRTARMGADGTVYSIIADGENIPEYVTWQREFQPRSASADPIRSDFATIYINAGKKEKISRGDIAGFLMHKGDLKPDQVGKIILDDHSAIVAVPRTALTEKGQPTLLERLAPHKLKNTRVRLSLLK
jgi:superfamily II DNA/RNA helicase